MGFCVGPKKEKRKLQDYNDIKKNCIAFYVSHWYQLYRKLPAEVVGAKRLGSLQMANVRLFKSIDCRFTLEALPFGTNEVCCY